MNALLAIHGLMSGLATGGVVSLFSGEPQAAVVCFSLSCLMAIVFAVAYRRRILRP